MAKRYPWPAPNRALPCGRRAEPGSIDECPHPEPMLPFRLSSRVSIDYEWVLEVVKVVSSRLHRLSGIPAFRCSGGPAGRLALKKSAFRRRRRRILRIQLGGIVCNGVADANWKQRKNGLMSAFDFALFVANCRCMKFWLKFPERL